MRPACWYDFITTTTTMAGENIVALYSVDLDFCGTPEDCGVTTEYEMVRVWNAEFAPNCGAVVVKTYSPGMQGTEVRVTSRTEDGIREALNAYCNNDAEDVEFYMTEVVTVS